MKKFNFIFAIAMMVVAAASVAVVSCKKDNASQTSESKTVEMSASDSNMDEYLISFKKRLLSAQKGGESISPEQAQRDLGNLLNFDFGDTNYESNVYQVDTVHVKLTLTNGQIDLSDLAVTYNNAVQSILDIYHNIDLPEKSISSISCHFCEPESKEGESEDVEIIVVSRGYSSITPAMYTHDTLDWRPKNFAGTCDGQFVGLYGAPEIITRWIYWSRNTLTCPNGGRMYLTDVDHWQTKGYRHFDTGTGLFKIYTSFEPNMDLACVTHDEMEYHYTQILDLYHQQPFGNHRIDHVTITDCYVHQGWIPGLNEVLDFYTWQVTIRHGKVNCTTGQSPVVND